MQYHHDKKKIYLKEIKLLNILQLIVLTANNKITIDSGLGGTTT